MVQRPASWVKSGNANANLSGWVGDGNATGEAVTVCLTRGGCNRRKHGDKPSNTWAAVLPSRRTGSGETHYGETETETETEGRFAALRDQPGTAGSDSRGGLSLAWWLPAGEEDAKPVVVEVAESAA